MKVYVKGFEESKQGRKTLYNGWDENNTLHDIPVEKLGDKLNEIYNKDFGEVEFVEIKIRHKLKHESVKQDERYIKTVGIDIEKRLVLSFFQAFIISQFITLYLALTDTVHNYHTIIYSGHIGEIIGLFVVNGIAFGMIFSFGVSNLIFLIRYMVFQYKEKRYKK